MEIFSNSHNITQLPHQVPAPVLRGSSTGPARASLGGGSSSVSKEYREREQAWAARPRILQQAAAKKGHGLKTLFSPIL